MEKTRLPNVFEIYVDRITIRCNNYDYARVMQSFISNQMHNESIQLNITYICVLVCLRKTDKQTTINVCERVYGNHTHKEQ